MEVILRKITFEKIDSIWLSRTSCHVLTELARLDCVIISLVIRLTSVSGLRNTALGKESSFITRAWSISVPLSHAHSTHSQVSRIVYSEWNVSPKGKFLQFMQIFQVYRLDRVFFHELHHPPCCLSNFSDYGRQFHEGDRDTRSQSQNEEGPFLLSLQGTSVRFRRNLPHWSISEGLISNELYKFW